MKRCRLVYVLKLTTFLAPYENVLITCCQTLFIVCMCQYGNANSSWNWRYQKSFFCESAWEGCGFKKKKNYILREIPKTPFMDFGLLYQNDKGEYVVLNDVRMADIRLVSLVYLLVYVCTYCVPIALLRQNKPLPLLYLGHAQIMRDRSWFIAWGEGRILGG